MAPVMPPLYTEEVLHTLESMTSTTAFCSVVGSLAERQTANQKHTNMGFSYINRPVNGYRAVLTIILVQRSPPRDDAPLPGDKHVGLGGQADGLDVRAEGEGRLQLQHGDVVVAGEGVVVRRHQQGLDVDGPGLELLPVNVRGPDQSRPLFGVSVTLKQKQNLSLSERLVGALVKWLPSTSRNSEPR